MTMTTMLVVWSATLLLGSGIWVAVAGWPRRAADVWCALGGGWIVGASACGMLVRMLAAQALFWLFTFPVNAATANWTQVTPDWDDLRGQWEWSHTAGAACQFLALCSLLTALFARVRAAGR